MPSSRISRSTATGETLLRFEEAGIEFIGAPGEGSGVRLWKKMH
jgi:hypothetical protein